MRLLRLLLLLLWLWLLLLLLHVGIVIRIEQLLRRLCVWLSGSLWRPLLLLLRLWLSLLRLWLRSRGKLLLLLPLLLFQ